MTERLSALQRIPDQFRTPEFRILVWTIWLLPLLQCLTAGLATPKPPSLAGTFSGFLFWACAIYPLWWLSHFASKLLLARLGTEGMRHWLGLALAGALAFLAADLLGYFFVLDLIFDRWLGGFEPPFEIQVPHPSNIFSKAVLFGALGHTVIWLGANLSARFLLGKTIYEPDRETAVAAPMPAFLHRLPEDQRKGLLAIQAQEHYIAVHTAGGTELVLYRFGDALRELAEVPGIQVHRSFWVADNSVVSYERKSSQLLLTLRNGLTVPVSRSFVRDVEQSGLLPKPA